MQHVAEPTDNMSEFHKGNKIFSCVNKSSKLFSVGLLGKILVGTTVFEGENAIQNMFHIGINAIKEIDNRTTELFMGKDRIEEALLTNLFLFGLFSCF